jgi:hypothetical protein
MSRESDIQRLFPRTIVIPTGVTAAVLIDSTPYASGTVLQYVSGGTCWILGATYGLTASGASLLNTFTGGTSIALLMSGLALNLDGSPSFYLGATGATVTVQIIGGLANS